MSNIPDDPIIFDDDEEVTPFRRILDLVMEQKEVILTIAPEDEAATRRGLTMQKARDVQKQKNANIIPGDEVLSYNSYPNKEDSSKIDLHVKLTPRKGVRVFSIKTPDDSI